MAKSKFEYVKAFEHIETLLPNTYIVIRLDGRSFSRFTTLHNYEKPNDCAGAELMNLAAKHLMTEIPDIILGYGQSDEFSFLLRRESTLWGRRRDKLVSSFVSIFTSAYVRLWSEVMRRDLNAFPSFDARAICYPTQKNVIDYFSWRQADCHINNLYNTCFWALVHEGKSEDEAEKLLSKTLSADKNELLYQRGINYNSLSEIFRKGSILWRDKLEVKSVSSTTGEDVVRRRPQIVIQHFDIIQNPSFWSDKIFGTNDTSCEGN